MEGWTERRKEFPNGGLTVTHTEVSERIKPSPQGDKKDRSSAKLLTSLQCNAKYGF